MKTASPSGPRALAHPANWTPGQTRSPMLTTDHVARDYSLQASHFPYSAAVSFDARVDMTLDLAHCSSLSR